MNIANLTKICSALEQVRKKCIQKEQPNEFQCYNQSMGFVKRMEHNVAKHRLASEWKNGGGKRSFEW